MNASKENALKAKDALTKVQMNLPPGHDVTKDLVHLSDFLDAAERKLPREESFTKDAQRESVAEAAKRGFNS